MGTGGATVSAWPEDEADLEDAAAFVEVAFFFATGRGGGCGAGAGAATAGVCGAACLVRVVDGDEEMRLQAKQPPIRASGTSTAVRDPLLFFPVFGGCAIP